MKALLVGWRVLNGFFGLCLFSEFFSFALSIGAGDRALIRASGMAGPVGPALRLAVVIVVLDCRMCLGETSRAPALAITGWGARAVIMLSACSAISVWDIGVDTFSVGMKTTSEDVGILSDEIIGCFEGGKGDSH